MIQMINDKLKLCNNNLNSLKESSKQLNNDFSQMTNQIDRIELSSSLSSSSSLSLFVRRQRHSSISSTASSLSSMSSIESRRISVSKQYWSSSSTESECDQIVSGDDSSIESQLPPNNYIMVTASSTGSLHQTEFNINENVVKKINKNSLNSTKLEQNMNDNDDTDSIVSSASSLSIQSDDEGQNNWYINEQEEREEDEDEKEMLKYVNHLDKRLLDETSDQIKKLLDSSIKSAIVPSL
jgi:hypothetical protein